MEAISLKTLLEAGVHFGHQVSRWNPKMRGFLFGDRGGIHIIDLEQTLPMLHKAYGFIVEQVAHGGSVLFVGTKPQAAEVVEEEAKRCEMYYVNKRWLGGMLTNFRTIKQSIGRLKDYYTRKENGELAKLRKKEQLTMEREAMKVEHSLGGISTMESLPAVVIVVDPNRERIAQREAARLHIPVVGLVDSNCDPDGVDFVIPGNDDAMRSIRLVVQHLADACVEGMSKRREVIQKELAAKPGEGKEADGGARVEERKIGGRGRAYVGREEGKGKPKGKSDVKVAETLN